MTWAEPMARIRWVGFTEAISFLLLLGIAMPLKYLAGRPEAVQVIGMAHGVLWVLYLLLLAQALGIGFLTRMQTFWGLVASVLPFGPIVYDFWLLKRLREPGGFPETPS